MRGFFGKKKRGEFKPAAIPSTVDEDETIVINLSGEETVAPDSVRVEFESGAAGTTTLGSTETGHAAQAAREESPDPREPDQGRNRQSRSPLAAPSDHDADSDMTQIWSAGGTLPPPASPITDGSHEASDSKRYRSRHSAGAVDLSAPVAGLLMVVEGLGQGLIFCVSLGRNKIGRGPGNEICLNVGDDAISRHNHATIAADPKTKRVFLIPGDSTNLAYLDEEPLLESCELRDKATIQLGETKAIFIQVLGNYIDWD